MVFSKSLKIVFLEVLEQVSVQNLKEKALVLAKARVFKHAYYVMLIFRVFFKDKFKQFGFLFSEFMVNFSISVHFKGVR